MSEQHEMDVITSEIGRATARARDVVMKWRGENRDAKRLPRAQRREVSRIIREGWRAEEERQRLIREDLQRQVLEHQHYMRDLSRNFATGSADLDTARLLQADRQRIERRIHTAPTLTATERGQAAAALAVAHHAPHEQLRTIWNPRAGTGIPALRARVQAGLSRLRAGFADATERPRLDRWQRAHDRRAAAREMQTPDWVRAAAREIHPDGSVWAADRPAPAPARGLDSAVSWPLDRPEVRAGLAGRLRDIGMDDLAAKLETQSVDRQELSQQITDGLAFRAELIGVLERDVTLYQRMSAVHQEQQQRWHDRGLTPHGPAHAPVPAERAYQSNLRRQAGIVARKIGVAGLLTQNDLQRVWDDVYYIPAELGDQVAALSDRALYTEYARYGSPEFTKDRAAHEWQQRGLDSVAAARFNGTAPDREHAREADQRFGAWIDSLDPVVPMPGPAAPTEPTADREQVVSLHRDAQLFQRMTAVHRVQIARFQAAGVWGVSVDPDSYTEEKFRDNYLRQSTVLSRQIDLTGVAKAPDGRTWGEPSEEMLAEVNAMDDRDLLAEYRLYGSFIHAGDITTREDEQRVAGREHAARGGHFGQRDLSDWESSFELAAPEDAALYAPEFSREDHAPEGKAHRYEPDHDDLYEEMDIDSDDPRLRCEQPERGYVPDLNEEEPFFDEPEHDPEQDDRAARVAELSAELERVRQERDELLHERDRGWSQYGEWMRSEQRGNGDAAASADRDVDDGPDLVEQLAASIDAHARTNGAADSPDREHDQDWEGFDR